MSDVLTLDGAAVDRYADVLAVVAAALVDDDLDLARLSVSPIAGERWLGKVSLAGPQQPDGVHKRVPIKERDRAQTLIRDGFRCGACGGRAVPRGVLVALSDVLPEELPYQQHYKRGEIHPVYWALAAEADHVVPSSSGGSSELTNLRTIHAFCNTQRGNALLEAHQMNTLATSADPRWDGLIGAYPRIVAVAAARGFAYSSAQYHHARMRAFGISS
ncbi:HNH endonuclease [Leifsonia sp. P73]|uniref:HNH endonuclease n=1 Tax=Leifsonia sp. P73 TaxID=3423959 RepID=UPI003DA55B11